MCQCLVTLTAFQMDSPSMYRCLGLLLPVLPLLKCLRFLWAHISCPLRCLWMAAQPSRVSATLPDLCHQQSCCGCTLHHHPDREWGCLIFFYLILFNTVTMSTQSSPLGYTTSDWTTFLHFLPLITLDTSVQPLYNPARCSSSSYFMFTMRILEESVPKSFHKHESITVLIYKASHFTKGVYQAGQAHLPLGETILTTPKNWSFIGLERVSKFNHSITFPGLKWDLLAWVLLPDLPVYAQSV